MTSSPSPSRSDLFDPAYDVEVREDLDGFREADRDINRLTALATAMRPGAEQPTRFAPAKRNPGVEQRVARATTQFTSAAQRLIGDYAKGRITRDEFVNGIAAVYVRQATNAFIAGKRALGNLAPLTEADEAEISRTLATLGLDPDRDVPPTSLGALIERMASSAVSPEEARRLPGALTRYTQRMLTTVMHRGYARAAATQEKPPRDGDARLARAIERTTAQATKRVNEELARQRIRLLSGTVPPGQAAQDLQDTVGTEARAAYLRARAIGGSKGDLDWEEVADVEDTVAAADADVAEEFGLAKRLTVAGVLAAIIIDPLNLRDTDVVRYLRRKIADVAGQFHALRMAGERAAFRIGGAGDQSARGTIDVPAPTRVAEWVTPPVFVPTGSPVTNAVIVWWTLGHDKPCPDCIRLSDMSPYYLAQLDAMALHPGSGHTRCGGRCRCHLEYDVPVAA